MTSDLELSTEHPYITRTPGICGGKPVIKGTRIPVKAVVGYYKMNYPLTEIVAGFPDLTPAQVFDALSYYYDHQVEVDSDIEAEELPKLLQKFNLEINSDGILSPKN